MLVKCSQCSRLMEQRLNDWRQTDRKNPKIFRRSFCRVTCWKKFALFRQFLDKSKRRLTKANWQKQKTRAISLFMDHKFYQKTKKTINLSAICNRWCVACENLSIPYFRNCLLCKLIAGENSNKFWKLGNKKANLIN